MLILRFGLSDDRYGDLPAEARSWHVAATRMADATGEPWETVFRDARPTPSFPEAVRTAVETLSPDVVLLCCAAYWVSYPSTPLRLRRSRLPLAQHLAKAGFWAAAQPRIASRAAFHVGRRLASRGASTAFFFEPGAVLPVYEEAFRVILRREDIALAVRGPLPLGIGGSPGVRAEAEARRARVNDALGELCGTLHIPYVSFAANDRHPREELLGDRIHVNAAGHLRRADHEYRAMYDAWSAHHAGSRD